MASRKEEKERLRQQRLAAQQRESASARRNRILGYGLAALLTAAVVVGLVIVVTSGGDGDGDAAGDAENAYVDRNTGIVPEGIALDDREGTPPPPVQQADLERAARAADCRLRLDVRDEGNRHLRPDAEPADYGTNPPTSGDHSPEPLADGAYLDPPDPINFVHSLEHGRVLIQYSPDLPEDAQLALKGVFEEDAAGMLMFPNPDMPYEVATTAWTNLMGCESYQGRATLDAVRAFRDTFRGQGPEPVPL